MTKYTSIPPIGDYVVDSDFEWTDGNGHDPNKLSSHLDQLSISSGSSTGMSSFSSSSGVAGKRLSDHDDGDDAKKFKTSNW